MDDMTLWSSLIEGNLRALETIYKRHYALLLNYGLKFCQDIELTKDCIQDVFVKLHKSKELSQTVSPRAYLLKALRNTLYDNLLLSKETTSLDEFAFHISESHDLFEQLFFKNDEDLQLSKQLLKAFFPPFQSENNLISSLRQRVVSQRNCGDNEYQCAVVNELSESGINETAWFDEK